MSTDITSRHHEVDKEVRRILGRDSSSDAFDYHILKLCILIDRNINDKELAREMLNEIRLVVEDLHARIHRL